MNYLSFLFEIRPSTTFGAYQIAFACVAFFFVMMCLSFFFRKNASPALRKSTKSSTAVFAWLMTSSLIMTLSRLSGVMYFSMRALWIAVFVCLLWYMWNVRRSFVSYRRKETIFSKKNNAPDTFKKYLPKKKKKSKK
ncbi:hypothetical protein COB57_04230 [Candidatus Peregrinibacteria bacterium]|nr:MAG: hypothetical protein COB57_04230 [Candidatus Peregrinibacteria bacterium]